MSSPEENADSTVATMNGQESEKVAQGSSVSNHPQWVMKRLRTLKKETILDAVAFRQQFLTPFEMRMIIDPAEIATLYEMRSNTFGRFLESWRNALILAPIMVTWFSLALASAAYQQTSLVDKTTGKTTDPFLQVWEQGFPALKSVIVGPWHFPLLWHIKNHYFTFSGVALTDALLLAFIFLFTIFSQLNEYSSHRRSIELYQYLEDYLHTMSLNSTLWSLGRGEEQVPGWLRGVHDSMIKMNELMAEVRGIIGSTIDSYTRAVIAQKEAVGNLVEDTSNIHNAVSKVKDLVQESSETYKPLLDLINAMEKHARSIDANQQITAESWQAMTNALLVAVASIATLSGDPALVQRAKHTAESYANMSNNQPLLRPVRPLTIRQKAVRFIKNIFRRS